MRPRSGNRKLSQKNVILGAAVAIVSFLAITPLIFLTYQALFSGGFSLETLTEAGSAGSIPRLAGTSMVFALGTVALAVTVGTTLAYIYERTDIPFRSGILVVALLPLVIPNLLYTIAWIFLASPRVGILNGIIDQSIGITPFDIFSLPGMIWVEGTNLSSLVFLIVAASIRSADPALEEAAAMAGARGPTTLRRITLPLAAPAIAGAALLVGMRALGTFETPALLGLPGGIHVFTSTIWLQLSRFPASIENASGLSLWLIGISAILVVVYFKSVGGERAIRFQTISGKDFRVRRHQLQRRTKVVVTVAVGLWLVVALILPLAAIAYTSLLPTLRLPSLQVLQTASLANFSEVLQTQSVARAFVNSFILAGATGLGVMLLSSLTTWFMLRTRQRGRWLVDVVAFTPMAMPGLVLGLAILILYIRVPLPIYGTLAILLIAYITSFLPHGIRYASPAVIQIGSELEEAAEVSGASWSRMYRKITFPLMLPGLVAGWMFIAAIALRELSASLLVYSPGNEVLGVALWDMWHDGQTGDAAALGVLMTGALLALLVLVRVFGGKSAKFMGVG